jgi:S1-C subfamily serine protease
MKFVQRAVGLALFITLACGSGRMVSQAEAGAVEDINALTQQSNFVLGDGEGWCSGTLISKKYRLVITANHCVDQLLQSRTKKKIGPHGEVGEVEVEDRKNMVLTQRDYSDHDLVSSKSWIARIVDYNAVTDLALLQIKRKDIPQTIEAKILPEGRKVIAGMPVWGVGNPAMLDNSLLKGIISNTNRRINVAGEDTAYNQFQMAIIGGISGGALLTDDLYYVGTIVAGIGGSDISLSIPIEAVRKILKKNCFAQLVKDSKQNADKDAKCRAEKKLDDTATPKAPDDEDEPAVNEYTGGPH